jgi:putative ABC transport system permease protein
VKSLDKKLLRDLQRLKGQVAAIGLIVACAVAAQVAAASTAQSLADAVTRYYARHRFPDVFAQARRAPESLASRLAEIPGVALVETRVTTDAPIELSGFDDPMRGQVVSIPEGGQPRLSLLQVKAGRMIARGASEEALISAGFFAAHRMKLGDRLMVILNGKRQPFRIVGVALSPEYVYPVRPGELVPDELRNAVLFVSRDALGGALDLQGAFNDVALRLSSGASQPEVLARVDRLLNPYGGTGARGRDRHGSAKFLSDKTVQLQKQATVAPLIFFAVAAYLLSFLLSRLVANQRQEIGTVRALGYTQREIAVHYLKMVVAVLAVGVPVGLPLGALLGAVLSQKYSLLFGIPDVAYALDTEAAIGAVVASLAFGLLGASSAVRRAMRLEPAEAMRPPPPASFRKSALEGLAGELLPLASRMAVRNLARRPLRSVLTSIGIAAASATIMAGAFFFDGFNHIIWLQFERASRQDVTVTLTDPRDASALDELRRLPGVLRVEPFRDVPAVLRHEQWNRDLRIVGLREQPELFRPVSATGAAERIPREGLVLSRRLADALHVRPGDDLLVDVREGTRPRLKVKVAGVIDDVVGMSAYADIGFMARWLGEQLRVSGAYLNIGRGGGEGLYRKLRELPRVAGATLKGAEVTNFREKSGTLMLLFAGLFMVFGAVLAGGVVYNAARASFAERERELATLRLIGFTQHEVLTISLTEIWIQVLLAIPLGALFGRGFAGLLARSTATDILRLPVVVSTTTYLFAGALTVLSALGVGPVVRGWVRRLDMIEVLKSKE